MGKHDPGTHQFSDGDIGIECSNLKCGNRTLQIFLNMDVRTYGFSSSFNSFIKNGHGTQVFVLERVIWDRHIYPILTRELSLPIPEGGWGGGQRLHSHT